MTEKLIIVAILSIICRLGYSQQTNIDFPSVPIIQNFTTDDYLGGLQNWSISQDTQGLLYVANNDGLLQFDGQDWRLYKPQTTGTKSLSLLIDEDNKIYLGGQNQIGYFEPNHTGTLSFTSLQHLIHPDSLNIDNIWKIHKLNQKIFFNTNTYTYVYDGQKIQSIKYKNKIGYVFKAQNQLYAYSQQDGLLILRNNEFTPIKNGAFMANKSIIEILPFYDQSLLIMLSDGKLYLYRDGIYHLWQNDLTTFFPQSVINTAIILSNHNIAIGTQNNGLIILSPEGKLKQHLNRHSGLNSSTIYSLYQDQFNNIWAALSNGISLIAYGSPFSLIDQRVGVAGTGYAAAYYNNKIYLGTNTGLFTYDNDKRQYQLVKNSEGQVYNLCNLNQKLLMGHHQGAYQIKDNEATKVFDQTGVWTFASLGLNDGYLAGTYDGIFKTSPDLNQFSKLKEFNESSRLIDLKNDTILWMSHGYKGVYQLVLSQGHDSIKKITHYDSTNGFPSNVLINQFTINHELLYPAETGIYKFEESQNRFIHEQKYEPIIGADEHISNITADHLGNIYFIKKDQLGLLKKDRFGNFELESSNFNHINKYLSDDLENIHIIDHQNILFGAKDGFVLYDPTENFSKTDSFQIMVRSIEITKDTTVVITHANNFTKHNKTFAPDLSSIKFTYASPYFDGFNELTYQYFLEGFDLKWSEFSKENKKEYTNLSAGQYIFKVRAKNIYGDISNVTTYHFNITPPWYASNLAIIGYCIFALIGFGIGIFMVDKKHLKERKKLEINQKREIIQKNIEIKHVTETSEAKIIALKNDKLKSEVEFKNKELTSTTMHLINKNEVLLNIKSRLESLTKSASPKKEEVKKIIKNIEQNLREDQDWEQFTFHFDQVHEGFLKKLKMQYSDLTPQESKLAAYLRMNLSSKEVAQLMNISVRGVEISRYRLRKKLELSRETNLVSFLMDI